MSVSAAPTAWVRASTHDISSASEGAIKLWGDNYGYYGYSGYYSYYGYYGYSGYYKTMRG